MRVSIVFPNSLCLPNPIYYSLPLLASSLSSHGHRPRIFDLNVMAADLFLDRRRSENYLQGAGQLVAAHRACDRREEADRLNAMLDAMSAKVLDGEECKHILRDRDRGFEPASFKHAFWNVVDVLGFYYQLDPIISPHREHFGDELIAHLDRDPWSPIRDLHEECLVERVLSDGPGLVAISVAFPEQSVEAMRLARMVKRRSPGTQVAFGGPLISLHSDKWLAGGWIFDDVDSICVGDGERTIVELCEALEGHRGMESVRNLVWRDSSGRIRTNTPVPFLESMDEVPVPDFDSADMGLYLTPGPIWPMMTSRGCYWGRCTFCSIGWRENYRMASAEKIRADALHMAKRYGAKYVQMQDSSIPPAAARNLSRVIREEGLDLHWGAGMKFEKCHLDADWCRELAAGNCRTLLVGIESANQEIVDRMDKGFRVEEVPAMLRNLRGAGISVELLWFIGFPGETRSDALATAQYLDRHRDLFGLTAFVGDYLLHPDTIVFERPEDFGVTVISRQNDHCVYVVAKGMQPDEAETLKRLLACNNNRTLVCSGSHLPQIVERGLDLSGLERPHRIPPEVVAWCSD